MIVKKPSFHIIFVTGIEAKIDIQEYIKDKEEMMSNSCYIHLKTVFLRRSQNQQLLFTY
jgi:hypothetical protein